LKNKAGALRRFHKRDGLVLERGRNLEVAMNHDLIKEGGQEISILAALSPTKGGTCRRNFKGCQSLAGKAKKKKIKRGGGGVRFLCLSIVSRGQ